MEPLRRKRGGRSKKPEGGGRAGEFSQLALWTAANLAGMVTAILLVRGPFFRKLLGKMGRAKKRAARPTREQSLPILAGTIVGSSKATIESVLGPPRSAALKGVGVVTHPKMVFWQADTWYYPLPRNGPVAMAINFDEDFATQVEFFSTPSLPPKLA